MTTTTLRLPPRIAHLPQLRQIVRGGLAARGSVGMGLAAKAGGAAGNGLLNGLVSYWKLDEGSGNRVDSHGTTTMVPVSTPGNRTGKIGKALDLTANAKFLAVASPSTALRIPASGASASISVWFLLDSMPAVAAVIASRWDSTTDWLITISADGSGGFSLAATSGGDYSYPASTFTTGTWYHLVGVFNHTVGAYGTIYQQLNGGAVQSGALLSQHTSAASIRTFIGGLNAGTYVPDGAVDEMAFWTLALSDTQKLALYNSGAGLAYSAFTT